MSLNSIGCLLCVVLALTGYSMRSTILKEKIRLKNLTKYSAYVTIEYVNHINPRSFFLSFFLWCIHVNMALIFVAWIEDKCVFLCEKIEKLFVFNSQSIYYFFRVLFDFCFGYVVRAPLLNVFKISIEKIQSNCQNFHCLK